MRVVVVSREAPDVDGVIVGAVGGERAEPVAKEFVLPRDLLYPVILPFPGDLMRHNLRMHEVGREWARDAYLSGFHDGCERVGALERSEIRHHGEILRLRVPGPRDWICPEVAGLIVTAGTPLLGVQKLLAGRIAPDRQLPAVLAADSGTSAVHIVSQERARNYLRRQGGGVIEDGLYALHPKRSGVLVPLLSYHQELLAEMQREARVTMGRLGARKLTIETFEGVSFSGAVVSRVPLKSGNVQVNGASEQERIVTYEWGSPTFEPEAALADCVLLQDNSGVMTIVEQRRTSNLTRYAEFSRIDTRFGVALDVLGVFNADFKWAAQSTYRYEIEFFPRP